MSSSVPPLPAAPATPPRQSLKPPLKPRNASSPTFTSTPPTSLPTTPRTLLSKPPTSPLSKAFDSVSLKDSSNDTFPEQLPSELLFREILSERTVSPRLISDCSEQHLLLIFPLVLQTVEKHQLSNTKSPLISPLLSRMCASRRVKLRFLLLRNHPAFSSLKSKLIFVSRAYGNWYFARGCNPTNPKITASMQSKPHPNSLRVPVDMVDLQSEDFFRNILFKVPPKHNFDFGLQLISHPFRVHKLALESSFNGPDDEESYISSLSDNTEDYYPDQELAESACVQIILNEPLIELRHLSFEEEVVSSSTMVPLLPRLMVRKAAPILQIQLSQMLLLLFNYYWSQPTANYPDAHSAPVCVTFDVIATSQREGLIQAFSNVQHLHLFSFDFWRDTRGRDPVIVEEFIRSAAGAFTAAYVCGLNTHNAAVFCVKDGSSVFLRDFCNLFQGPAAPRVGIPKLMRRCLVDMGVWDEFFSRCLQAFDVLRQRYDDIFTVMSPLFALSGIEEKQISAHLSAKHCFNASETKLWNGAQHFRRWLG